MYQCLLKCRTLWNQKKKNALTSNTITNERKWHQPWFQLCLVTQSRSRQELGLWALSAVVHLWEMKPSTMFYLFKLFDFARGKFTEHFHFSVHRQAFSFLFFVCWLWAPSFWLCLCANSTSRLCCTHISYHWCKIRNVSHRLMQIFERQHDPRLNLQLQRLSWQSMTEKVKSKEQEWCGFQPMVWQGLFLPESTFSADSLSLRLSLKL